MTVASKRKNSRETELELHDAKRQKPALETQEEVVVVGLNAIKDKKFPEHLKLFIPPTISDLFVDATITENDVLSSIHDSYTYISKIPPEIKKLIDNSIPCEPQEIVLGIDEAGRGPVLGSMVYSLAYSLKSNLKILNDNEFDDSKKLTDLKRTQLFYKICTGLNELSENIGYSITNLTARDISSEMMNSMNFNNLNNQAHETTIKLITQTLQLLGNNKRNVRVSEIYIDTVGPPTTYQAKLIEKFSSFNIKITVSKKADSIYPIVSAASVVAKVTRDIILEQYNLKFHPNISYGSGYPGDPKTVLWLNVSMNRFLGWNQVVRYSWQTTRTLLKQKSDLEIIWEDDIRNSKIDYGNNVDTFFKKTDNQNLENLELSTLWFGESVTNI